VSISIIVPRHHAEASLERCVIQPEATQIAWYACRT
jgi:hypothetical protein